MALLLALTSSLLLGSADFVGGLATRRARAMLVVVWSNAAGLASALVLVLTLLPGRGSAADLAWGALAGVSGSLGAVLLYRALAYGVMAVVAPVSAATAAAIPVVAGLAMGEQLTLPRSLGIVAALLSVVLISRSAPGDQPVRTPRTRGLVSAALAGISFGIFLVLLAQTSSDSGLWPLVGARVASLTLLIALLVGRRQSLRLPTGSGPYAWTSGLLDMASSGCYLVAVRGGELATIGLLASLSPLGTVLLARLVLGERIRRVQGVGAGLAMGSVLLFSVQT